MFLKNHPLRFVLVAVAMAAIAACSQSGTTTPSVSSAQAIAPQAKRMLALVRGRNHAVIPAHVGIAALFAPVRPDANTTMYDSIVVNTQGKPYSDISSEGFECCSTDEFGDALNLSKANARVTKVSVVMSSWACESGSWFSDCETNRGSSFSEPITLTIYGVTYDTNDKPQPGAVLLQQTATFQIPYRPSGNPKCAGSYGDGFVGRYDRECDDGLSKIVSFNTRSARLTLPQQVIVTVAYNTSDSGYQPYGQNTQCFTGPGGCGYDSLNVSADGSGGFIGSPIDSDGVQVYFTDPTFYCSGQPENPNLKLQDDYACWGSYHPEIELFGTAGALN